MRCDLVSLACLGLGLLPICAAGTASAAGGKGEFTLTAVDKSTGQPVPVRLHLRDQRGKPVQVPGQPFWRDHLVFDGSLLLELPPGNYTFEMERGPEYKLRSGHFSLDRTAKDSQTVEMERFVDMQQEGWWSGDLHVERSPDQIELLMRAEDLHFAPLIAWRSALAAAFPSLVPPAKAARSQTPQQPAGRALPAVRPVLFDQNRFYDRFAGLDQRAGGPLLYCNLAEPLPVASAGREFPSPVVFLQQALAQSAPQRHMAIGKPFAWDLPVWIALGGTDSVLVAHSSLQRDGVTNGEPEGRPRDGALFPGVSGNARWSQDIYFKLLNCGFRIPPTAGSGSGAAPNPLGYNRVYAYCPGEPSWSAWWQAVREGKVVVTNGPLLRPKVNGQPPGHLFQAERGETVELSVALNLATREPIDYLEVIQDGVVVHEVRLDQWAQARGKLPSVKFTRSGWLCVRAVTNAPKTYRFALTGPYYVEIGYEKRVSKAAAQFFADWVYERALGVKCDTPEERTAVIEHHRTARDFWKKLVEAANAP